MQRDIEIRRLELRLSAETPRHWFAGNPLLTHLLNALSVTFPAGERFFVDSVRRFHGQISEPLLKRQVRSFLAQEALHSQQHQAFNDWVTAQGLGVDVHAARVDRNLKENEAKHHPLTNLAETCALEHFTAIMAAGILAEPTFVAAMHPDVRPLWVWHALEEIEHKAVAFDVYRSVGGGYWRRVTSMMWVTFLLGVNVAWILSDLLRQDKEVAAGKKLGEWLRQVAAMRRYLFRVVPAYFRYYSPRFHPWEHDDSQLVETWSSRLEGGVA